MPSSSLACFTVLCPNYIRDKLLLTDPFSQVLLPLPSQIGFTERLSLSKRPWTVQEMGR